MMRIPLSRKFREHAILGVAAFLLSGAFVRVISSGDSELVTSGDHRYELLLAAVYFSVLFLALARFKKTLRIALNNPALTALLLLTCVSALWAEMPGLVLRRTVAVAGTTLFGLVLASRLDLSEMLCLLRRVVRIATGLTLAAWALGPFIGTNLVTGESTQIGGYQIEIDPGAWRGIFTHKNNLGAVMALAILVEWHMSAHTRRSKFLKAFWISCYAGLLILSNSVTSLTALGIAISLMIAIKILRHEYRLIAPVMLLVTIFSGAVVALAANSVTGALGRSADLSGRADLWQWVAAMIQRRPILGYGFSGFWRGASHLSNVVEARIGWSPEYAHNGYLEITLSLGIVGLMLFLWFAGTGIWRGAIRAKNAESIEDLWPLAFLIFFLVHNLGECTILWQNSLEWALCVASVIGSDSRIYSLFEPAATKLDAMPEAELEYS